MRFGSTQQVAVRTTCPRLIESAAAASSSPPSCKPVFAGDTPPLIRWFSEKSTAARSPRSPRVDPSLPRRIRGPLAAVGEGSQAHDFSSRHRFQQLESAARTLDNGITVNLRFLEFACECGCHRRDLSRRRLQVKQQSICTRTKAKRLQFVICFRETRDDHVSTDGIGIALFGRRRST